MARKRLERRARCLGGWLLAAGLSAGAGCAGILDAPVIPGSGVPSTSTVAILLPPEKPGAAKDRAAESPASAQPSPEQAPAAPEVLPIDIATVLRLTDDQSPTINLARERVREAFAALERAEVLWLPTLQAGPTYQRHDGPWQRSTGDIIEVSKSSLFIGGGAQMRFDVADAYFGPLIARRLVQAQMENSRAVSNNVQLEAASTYLDLMQVYAALEINAEIIRRTEDLAKKTDDAAKAGVIKNTADTNRAQTELNLRREERITLEAQAAAVSARLAQLLYLEPTVDLHPADVAVVPIALVPTDFPLGEMVATAYLNRPELASNRALVEASIERWRQAKYAPLIPRIDVGYYAGDFGGGRNSFMGNFDSRGDGLAQAVWQLQNLGFGDLADVRLRESQVAQAMLHVQEVQAQVGAEVTAAAKQVEARHRALASAAEAVVQAEQMWRKLKDQAFGLTATDNLVDAIQPVLAVQALAQARVQYLSQVIEYNRAQFRLYVAMGRPPLDSLPHATPLPIPAPVLPPAPAVPKEAPANKPPKAP